MARRRSATPRSATPRRRSRPEIKNPWLAWLWDAGERVVGTFAAGVTSVFTIDAISDGLNASALDKLYTGLLTGAVMIVISLVGKTRGATDSASLLGPNYDPPLGR